MTKEELGFWNRVKYSFYATLIFLLITSPIAYQFTDSLFKGSIVVLYNQTPTASGYLLHAVLFFLVTLAFMMIVRS